MLGDLRLLFVILFDFLGLVNLRSAIFLKHVPGASGNVTVERQMLVEKFPHDKPVAVDIHSLVGLQNLFRLLKNLR